MTSMTVSEDFTLRVVAAALHDGARHLWDTFD
jgi:hypothetical protein